MSDTLNPLRLAIVFLGLLLPTLALIPLGSLWLWQHGYLIHWAIATLACTLIAYIFERTTLSAAPSRADTSDAVAEAVAIGAGEPERRRIAAEAAVKVLA